MFANRRPDIAALVLVAFCGALGLTIYWRLWLLDEDGLSIVSSKSPYWDFTNLWMGGKLALAGQVDTIFDPDAYRAALRALLHPNLPDQEWSYPPSMLLVGAPLALLPLSLAYLTWTVATLLGLVLALRQLKLPWQAQLAILVSPAVLLNMTFGQNGAMTAALLLAGLALAPARPVLAGMLFGLLTLKPHLGLLVPFCLIASHNWRAFAAAAATSCALFVATGLFLGFSSWSRFLADTVPLMTSIMDAPYPQIYHANAFTPFIFARWAGLGVTASHLFQAAASALAIAAAVWLWRPGREVTAQLRVALTGLLAIVATPYGYSYDSIPMMVAIAALYLAQPRPSVGLLGIFWVLPLLVNRLHYYGFGLVGIAPAILAVIAIYLVVRAQPRQSAASTAS